MMRRPLSERDTVSLWRGLRNRAYAPFFVAVFLVACFEGHDWSSFPWFGKVMLVGFAACLGFAASRSTCELIDELERRNDMDSNAEPVGEDAVPINPEGRSWNPILGVNPFASGEGLNPIEDTITECPETETE